MSGRLHILTTSPWADAALTRCLSVAAESDTVLLAGDAVYACAPGAAPFWREVPDIQRLVWDEDAALRGIAIASPFIAADAADIVRRIERAPSTVTWSV